MLLHRTFLSIVLISTFTLTACSKNNSSAAENLNSDKASSTAVTIAVGMDIAFPPYEYMENGKAAGFDVEMMDKILAISNTSANYLDTRFYNLISGIKSQKFDVVISGLYITPERMKQVDMIPYYKTTQAIVVPKNGSYQPKVIEDLCGKTIATQKGTQYPEQLKQIAAQYCLSKDKAGIQVLEFETSPQAIQAVLSKAADAEYDDIVAVRGAVKNLSERIEMASVGPFFPMFGGIVIRKGDTATYNRIRTGLDQIQHSGEYKKLLDAYGFEQPTADEIKTISATAKVQ